MPITEMQHFAQPRAADDTTIAVRLAMLRTHRSDLAERIPNLWHDATALDEKIKHYETLLDEQRETDTHP
ncbi:hypothetical protein ABT009_46485 [Streptomyces sp. NPDC002896]|uniref:hypothetical protein n=1 Tax=Streptomyces sp. NPDC002896 TaxID=3154438 RepID=UPI00332B787A